MKVTEGHAGRIFIIKLEHGDIIPDVIERFAAEKGVRNGLLVFVGGLAEGQVVVGPRRTAEMPPEPMLLPLDGAHETVGAGILAPDESGRPVLHIHASMGRSGQTITGCLRHGVNTWLTGEALLYEITGADAVRTMDKTSGFVLLDVPDAGEKDERP